MVEIYGDSIEIAGHLFAIADYGKIYSNDKYWLKEAGVSLIGVYVTALDSAIIESTHGGDL